MSGARGQEGSGPVVDPIVLATRVQRRAAAPGASVVLRAAAGSGKTRVLVDRFVRLCLAGSRPKAILAVTFTRKAAVEIKDRLLRRARLYAVLPEPQLAAELHALLDRAPRPEELRRAARLHAEVLEDLAGLQIGTIHAFCQRILGRMAAEMGLDPHFRVLEREDELWAEALDLLEREAAQEPGLRADLASLAGAPDVARRELDRLRADRVHLERWLDRLRRRGEGEPEGPADLLTAARLPLRPRLTAELRDALFAGTRLAGEEDPHPAALAGALSTALVELAGSGLDAVLAGEPQTTPGLQKQADGLRAQLTAAAEMLRGRDGAGEGADDRLADALAAVRGALLTGAGGLRRLHGKRDTAGTRAAAFAAAAGPVLELLRLAGLASLYRHNAALLRCGLRALDVYDELKRRDRCVDFQDLERLAWALLQGAEGLAVQYRFDEAVDHLLVDEFQDTNRNQWEILRPFAEEFLAGESARGVRRTVFLVGDVKQSIYGFRGAEPALFGEVAAWLRRQAGAPTESLPTNFRSLPAVVETVGRLMNRSPLRELLPPGEAAAAVQAAAREDGPGEVIILPALEAVDEGDSADRLAAAAAARIVRHLLTHGLPWRAAAALSCADILVLCRSRSRIAVYEQAFREAGIPIVPAGRGLLARSREVQDVLQLLRWLTFPGDDVALASVLRSAIFRVGEETLQRALARRGDRRSLWDEVRSDAAELELARPAALLGDWLEAAPFRGCHDLLRRILRTGQLPERYDEAHGEQARYNLLRLHDLALSPELREMPTLRAFADLIRRAGEAAAEEEATPPERGRGRVRLMTVHGAKGLEAPVVLLVDAAAPLRDDTDRLVLAPPHPDGPLLYGVRRSHVERPGVEDGEVAGAAPPPPDADPLLAAGERARLRLRREEANILYVAMTRARDALYVVGAEPSRRGERPSYRDWLESAAAADASEGAGAAAAGTPPYGLEAPAWLEEDEPGGGGGKEGPARSAGRPQDARAPRAWDPPPQRPVVALRRPSQHDETLWARAEEADAGGDETAATESTRSRDRALERGTAVHLWLQLAAELSGLPDASRPPGAVDAAAWSEARAVREEMLAEPNLAWIFAPEREGGRGLCEVPVLHRARPAGPGIAEERVYGVIDRLVLLPGRAEIVDYKSDLAADDPDLRAELVERYRPQLEAYRDAVAALDPDREVRAHLLFTRTGLTARERLHTFQVGGGARP